MTPASETVSTASRTTSERRIRRVRASLPASWSILPTVDPARAADPEADARAARTGARRGRSSARRGRRGGRTPPPTSPAPSGWLCSRVGWRRIGDVEERELRAERAAFLVRVLADAEQQVVADRVQVRRVAGDLQLAEHARLLRVGEVERVERVDLPERDDVADVAGEANGVDALALPELADPAGLHERRRPAGAASSGTTRSRRRLPTTPASRC